MSVGAPTNLTEALTDICDEHNVFGADGLDMRGKDFVALLVAEVDRWATPSFSELLTEECEKFGLPVSMSVLLRHIYANRDLVFAVKDYHIDLLSARVDAVIALHREHGPSPNGIHCCTHCRQPWPCPTIQAVTPSDFGAEGDL